jgi:glycosyltransferase involved in cell wall biosynthesis
MTRYFLEINSDKIKLLFLAWTIPPSANAMAIITRNLLKWFNADEVIMMGQIPFKGRIDVKDINHIHKIKIPNYFNTSLIWRVQPILEPFFVLPYLIVKSVLTHFQQRFTAIYVAFPNATFLLAGFILSKILRIPLYPHFHNLYPETRKNILSRFIAEKFQHIIFAHSEMILCMSKGMKDYYRKKYRINNVVTLLHPINYNKVSVPLSRKRKDSTYKIGLAGNINYTVYNPLIKIIENIGDDSNFKIKLHTPTDIKSIKHGLIDSWANNIEVYDAKTQNILLSSLNACSVLILALDNRIGEFDEEDFMTQFPTRTIEMLISGTPILLLCPKEYYIAKFFSRWNCGKVVDLKDVVKLKKVLMELCTNEKQKEIYIENAFRASEQFNGEKIAQTFRQLIKG